MTEILNTAASHWWSWMWPMFWQSSLLILAVGTADLLVRRWTWPQVRYALYLLVLVKLLLPPSLSSPASLAGMFSGERSIEGVVAPPVVQMPAAAPQMTSQAPSPRPARPPLSWQAYLMVVWCAGVVLLGSWAVLRFRALRSDYLGESPWAACPLAFAGMLRAAAAQLRLRRLPAVVFSSRVQSPAVFGVWRPVLVMPEEYLDYPPEDGLKPALQTLPLECQDHAPDAALRHVLLHELAHIKRGDLHVHAFFILLQILYWLNPLLWFVRRRLQHLRELCCDATVAAVLKEETTQYRETLLQAGRQLLHPPVHDGLGLLGLIEQPGNLLERLRRLEKKIWRHSRLRFLAVAVTVAVMFAAVLPMVKSQPTSGLEKKEKDQSSVPSVDALIAALESSDEGTRKEAAIKLGELGDKRAIEPLSRLLKKGEDDSCRDAMTALGQIGGKQAEEALLPWLGENRVLCETAATALEKAGWKPAPGRDGILYYLATRQYEEARKIAPEVAVSVNTIRGAVQTDLPILLPLDQCVTERGKEEAPAKQPSILGYPYLEFRESADGLAALLHLQHDSWPKVKWRLCLTLRDGEDKIASEQEVEYGNSGHIMTWPSVEESVLRFDCGKDALARKPKGFTFTLESVSMEQSNPFTFGKEIPLCLNLDTPTRSDVVRVESLKIEKGDGDAIVKAKAVIVSAPKCSWQLEVKLLDETGQVGRGVASFENSGKIRRVPMVSIENLDIRIVGSWEKVQNAKRYEATLERFAVRRDPTAGELPPTSGSLTQAGGKSSAATEKSAAPGENSENFRLFVAGPGAGKPGAYETPRTNTTYQRLMELAGVDIKQAADKGYVIHLLGLYKQGQTSISEDLIQMHERWKKADKGQRGAWETAGDRVFEIDSGNGKEESGIRILWVGPPPDDMERMHKATRGSGPDSSPHKYDGQWPGQYDELLSLAEQAQKLGRWPGGESWLKNTKSEDAIRERIRQLVKACGKNDETAVRNSIKEGKLPPRDMIRNMRESQAAGAKPGEIRSITISGNRAMVVTEFFKIADKKYKDQQCLIYTLERQGTEWRVSDIDMESVETLVEEIKRFQESQSSSSPSPVSPAARKEADIKPGAIAVQVLDRSGAPPTGGNALVGIYIPGDEKSAKNADVDATGRARFERLIPASYFVLSYAPPKQNKGTQEDCTIPFFGPETVPVSADKESSVTLRPKYSTAAIVEVLPPADSPDRPSGTLLLWSEARAGAPLPEAGPVPQDLARKGLITYYIYMKSGHSYRFENLAPGVYWVFLDGECNGQTDGKAWKHNYIGKQRFELQEGKASQVSLRPDLLKPIIAISMGERSERLIEKERVRRRRSAIKLLNTACDAVKIREILKVKGWFVTEE